jgi:pullulanase/glycogen debranching enzyme
MDAIAANARTLPLDRFDMTLNELIARCRIEWHGVVLGEPDWGDASHTLAATLHFDADRVALHFIFNAYQEGLEFAIPPLDANHVPWRSCPQCSENRRRMLAATRSARPSWCCS